MEQRREITLSFPVFCTKICFPIVKPIGKEFSGALWTYYGFVFLSFTTQGSVRGLNSYALALRDIAFGDVVYTGTVTLCENRSTFCLIN